jgi:Tfp pilus assembly protein PilF
MQINKICLTIFLWGTIPLLSKAQLPQTKIVNATLLTVESGMLTVPAKGKYDKLRDSLDKNLKKTPTDTTSLFYRALIYYSYNQLLAEPYQRTKGTLENLTIAKDMIEKAITLKMTDFRAKVLRAQIYSELCYRFTGDESWNTNSAQATARAKLFEAYKNKGNLFYDELAEIDKRNAYDYQKKRITYTYRRL